MTESEITLAIEQTLLLGKPMVLKIPLYLPNFQSSLRTVISRYRAKANKKLLEIGGGEIFQDKKIQIVTSYPHAFGGGSQEYKLVTVTLYIPISTFELLKEKEQEQEEQEDAS